MASRIVPPKTAFRATSRRLKRERIYSEHYLAWIRRLPCVVTGSHVDVQAAHVNYDDLRYGKLGRGKSNKDDDCWALPLTMLVHEEQHSAGNERDFWRRHGIDPCRVALALWRCYQANDVETAHLVIQHARDP